MFLGGVKQDTTCVWSGRSCSRACAGSVCVNKGSVNSCRSPKLSVPVLHFCSDCHRTWLGDSLHQGQDFFFFSVRFQVSFLALTTAWRDSISICMWCHCRRASHSSALAAFSASASLSILLLVPSSNYRGGTKDNIKNMQVTIIDCYIKMSGWNFCENCINVKFSVLYRGKGLIPLCLMGSCWPHLYPWRFVREEFSYKLPNCSETLLTSGVKGLRGGAEGSSFQVEIKCIDFNAFLISGFWVCFSFYPVKRSFLKPPLIVCGVILDLDLSLILICSCM